MRSVCMKDSRYPNLFAAFAISATTTKATFLFNPLNEVHPLPPPGPIP